MGMGPHGESLLARLDRPTEPALDTTFYLMEQQERQEQRHAARVRFAMKHQAKKKPMAPVEQTDKKNLEGERLWLWVGEDVPTKHLQRNVTYTAKTIRHEGFKLPVLEKKINVRKKKVKEKASD